jgi:hypothetical protein
MVSEETLAALIADIEREQEESKKAAQDTPSGMDL